MFRAQSRIIGVQRRANRGSTKESVGELSKGSYVDSLTTLGVDECLRVTLTIRRTNIQA